MKKILIIEDERAKALRMQQILADMGQVEVCTKPDVMEIPFEERRAKSIMPSKQEVIEKIKQADIILLDSNLGKEYDGSDLLPFCEGKKVIGISSTHEIVSVNFFNKGELSMPHIREYLRKLVLIAIEK